MLRHRKFGVCVFLVLLVAVGIAGMIYESPTSEKMFNQPTVESSFTLSDDPISIMSNGDFAGYASGGNGLPGNPWIIEDYVLSYALGEIIDIEGTTDYFVIENCTLSKILIQHPILNSL